MSLPPAPVAAPIPPAPVAAQIHPAPVAAQIPIAPLAVALGDPAGIGPEVAAAAWDARDREHLPPFFVIGDLRAVKAVWPGPIALLGNPADAAAMFPHALPLVQVDDPGAIVPGAPNLPGARCALDSLELGVGLARAGIAAGLITGPVSKAQLYAIGFSYPGQTEFIAERCGMAAANVAMMLAGPTLRTVPVTIHTALDRVPSVLTTELIVARAKVVHRGLQRDFGIAHPRLAVTGLNPHAGENGTLGRQEVEVITPAIEVLRAAGIDAVGPLSADAMFHPKARAKYDAAICMYHDQALIPLKTIHFDDGVNVTLGLPIVRTSPDHGTAFDLAGKGLASATPTIAAVRLAGEAAVRRRRG